MIHLTNERRLMELRWLNERRGHVPVIDRVKYPPINENSCPTIQNFERG